MLEIEILTQWIGFIMLCVLGFGFAAVVAIGIVAIATSDLTKNLD